MQRKTIVIILVIIAVASIVGYLVYAQKVFKSKTVSIVLPNDEDIVDEQGDENLVEIISGEDANQPEEPAVEDKTEKQKEKVIKDTDNVSEDDNLSIINKLVSWGYQSASGRTIDTIIIHSSYDALGPDPYNLTGLINEYKQYGVAPHYLIDRGGKTYKLVEEKNIAYHAGEGSVPDGRSGVNNFSIGIELMNQEDTKFTDAQYAALKKLIADIKSRQKIKYVLGHNQIAPGRKTDPWNFDPARTSDN